MSKRANGEGTVAKRARGGWEAKLTYIDPESGQRRRASFYAPTAKAARKKMNDARDRIAEGAPVRDATRSVGDWLEHWRATTLAASSRKESTQVLYAGLCRSHLEAAPFGLIPLDRLRPSDIDALVLAMRTRTKADGERALSDSTIRQVYTVLRAGLDGAVRDGLLARNPATLIKRPGVERREARHLDTTAVSAVLRAAEGSRYHSALALIAATGLRKGEALALRWDRVDLDGGALKVAATIGRVGKRLVVTEPKTERSRRAVPLNPAVVALLRRHRTAQKEDKMAAGSEWVDSGLVFTNEFGGPVEPRNLLRVIETAAKTAGVEGIGVHTLRHSAAVAWLDAGVHIKAVADLLGHSSIAITGDVYGHTSEDTARAAIDGLAGQLGL
jgi:integrase